MGERAFSLWDMEEFLKEAGAERVTEDAVVNLEKELEKLTATLANKAMMYAAHAGRRKLIKKDDVLLTRSESYVHRGAGVPPRGKRYVIRRRAGAQAIGQRISMTNR